MGALEKHFSNGKVTVILCRTWSEVQEAKMIRSIASCLKNWFVPMAIGCDPINRNQFQNANSTSTVAIASARRATLTIALCAHWPSNGFAFSVPAGRPISLTLSLPISRSFKEGLFLFLLLDGSSQTLKGPTRSAGSNLFMPDWLLTAAEGSAKQATTKKSAQISVRKIGVSAKT